MNITEILCDIVSIQMYTIKNTIIVNFLTVILSIYRYFFIQLLLEFSKFATDYISYEYYIIYTYIIFIRIVLDYRRRKNINIFDTGIICYFDYYTYYKKIIFVKFGLDNAPFFRTSRGLKNCLRRQIVLWFFEFNSKTLVYIQHTNILELFQRIEPVISIYYCP